MPENLHHYHLNLEWTGNTGQGTQSYTTYERSYQWHSNQKPLIEGSSDPKFRGDRTKHNPEELLLAALSSCHMLWYLHLCADNHITVLEYRDEAIGIMEGEKQLTTDNGHKQIRGGHFTHVLLKPFVKLAHKEDISRATALHHEAHTRCFIANSVNFPVETEPRFTFPE